MTALNIIANPYSILSLAWEGILAIEHMSFILFELCIFMILGVAITILIYHPLICRFLINYDRSRRFDRIVQSNTYYVLYIFYRFIRGVINFVKKSVALFFIMIYYPEEYPSGPPGMEIYFDGDDQYKIESGETIEITLEDVELDLQKVSFTVTWFCPGKRIELTRSQIVGL